MTWFTDKIIPFKRWQNVGGYLYIETYLTHQSKLLKNP